ncbi:hypothetical protein VB735_26195 [Halotia wernerae UHCC 0503]|nr:hypothetical protein [Halotia wernerae UHCC 0503]
MFTRSNGSAIEKQASAQIESRTDLPRHQNNELIGTTIVQVDEKKLPVFAR